MKDLAYVRIYSTSCMCQGICMGYMHAPSKSFKVQLSSYVRFFEIAFSYYRSYIKQLHNKVKLQAIKSCAKVTLWTIRSFSHYIHYLLTLEYNYSESYIQLLAIIYQSHMAIPCFRAGCYRLQYKRPARKERALILQAITPLRENRGWPRETNNLHM